jgi:hypothetical protein
MRTLGLLAAGLLVLGLARADETKIDLAKLPAKVTEAVKAKFVGAELVSASTEVENGKTHFEIALKFKGANYDVTYLEDGTLVSVEKESAQKDLPKAVNDALTAKYAKAEIKKVEEITKGDKVTYEVLLVTAEKKQLEVVFDPMGKVLEEEKKDGKDDKDEKKDKK